MAKASAVSDMIQERRQLLEQIAEDHGLEWRQLFAPGTSGCHELLDRVSLMAGMLERDILVHPACVRDEKWFGLASSAVDALQDLYQRIGELHVPENESGTK